MNINNNPEISMRVAIKFAHNIEFDESRFSSNIFSFTIDEKTFAKYISSTDDKISGFINLLDFLFKKYQNKIYKLLNERLNLETLYVIRAGKISPSTGKTDHGWSIYDSPNTMLGVIDDSRFVLWNAKGFKIGDKFKILDDQTHKVVFDQAEITDLVACNYKDFVAYSRKNGANIPVGPYKKQPGDFQFILYSIK